MKTFYISFISFLFTMNILSQPLVDIRITHSGGNSLIIELIPDGTLTGGVFGAFNFNLSAPSGVTVNINQAFFGTGLTEVIGQNYTYGFVSNNTNQNWTSGIPITVLNLSFTGGTGFGDFIITPIDFYVELNGNERNRNIINNANNVSLPINIYSFSASKRGERSVLLDWQTSSEINSAYFNIERSNNGDHWEYLAQVAAAGNSTGIRSYDYIDDQLPMGRNKNQIFYYRLRMVDLDGSFKYSDIRGVNFSQNSRGLVSVYPNPTSNFINVDLTGIDFETLGAATLYLYDMSGKLLIQKEMYGAGLEPIDVQNLPSEAYNVIIRHGDQQYNHKVIVTK